MNDAACRCASSTVCPSTPGAPLLRTTFSSARARFATDATSSSSRLVSAVQATALAVILRFALCSRKARPSDASDTLASPPPCASIPENFAMIHRASYERSSSEAGSEQMWRGAKLHIVYDCDAERPIDAAITPARLNDITAAQALPIAAGATYVFDLGYYDFVWWARLDDAGCRIVTRFKSNTRLIVVAENRVSKDGPILS